MSPVTSMPQAVVTSAALHQLPSVLTKAKMLSTGNSTNGATTSILSNGTLTNGQQTTQVDGK